MLRPLKLDPRLLFCCSGAAPQPDNASVPISHLPKEVRRRPPLRLVGHVVI